MSTFAYILKYVNFPHCEHLILGRNTIIKPRVTGGFTQENKG